MNKWIIVIHDFEEASTEVFSSVETSLFYQENLPSVAMTQEATYSGIDADSTFDITDSASCSKTNYEPFEFNPEIPVVLVVQGFVSGKETVIWQMPLKDFLSVPPAVLTKNGLYPYLYQYAKQIGTIRKSITPASVAAHNKQLQYIEHPSLQQEPEATYDVPGLKVFDSDMSEDNGDLPF